jgi:hypothetical protein
MSRISTTSWLIYGTIVCAQSVVSSSVARACGPSTSKVVCLDRYASVLPYHFFRNDTVTNPLPFGSTSVPNDTSFGLVQDADFIVFDTPRAFQLLGEAPQYDFMFNVSSAVHEAPVYVPSLNKLFLSQLAPPTGYLPQLVVDLNQDPPTLNEYLSDPPVYAPNGGSFHKGLIYWGSFLLAKPESSLTTCYRCIWWQSFHWGN